MEQLYVIHPERAEVWGRLRFVVLTRVYVHHALTNATVLRHLLDPSVTRFIPLAPADHAGQEMYSDSKNSNAGFSIMLMLSRHYTKHCLFDLRRYAVNPHRQPTAEMQNFLPDELVHEYMLLYEYHMLYRPQVNLPHPINRRRPPPVLPGSNQRFN